MKKEINHYIKTWERNCYFDGIPDEIPLRLDQLNKAPSYKRIAMAILKNDLEMLGVKPKKSKYYSVLKRIELQQKGKIKKEYSLFEQNQNNE